MVAAELFAKFTKFSVVNYVGVEDFSDRISFQYTVLLLLVCSTLVTVKTYFLSPVACLIPNEIGTKGGQDIYVNNFCWTEGTYAVPLNDFKLDNDLKDPLAPYAGKKIIYYQWVPFVLGLQAIMFYIPRVAWHLMSYNRAGTDIGHLIRTANDAVQADGEKHDKLIQHVCRRLEQLLFRYKKQDEAIVTKFDRFKFKLFSYISFLMPSQRLGTWLIFTYFCIKGLYLANAIGQLFLMRSFLGLNSSYMHFGIKILYDVINGSDWMHTMVFPRVGACAIFYRTASGGNLVYSQCTLPINMINEKIYVFLWFWFVLVIIVTFGSIPVWFIRIACVSFRAAFVKRYLKLSDNYSEIHKKDTKKFVREFLRQDGAFLLKMIAINCGDVVCTEILCAMWDVYLQRHYKQGFTKKSYYRLTLPQGIPISKKHKICSNSTPMLPTIPSDGEDNVEASTLVKRANANSDKSEYFSIDNLDKAGNDC